MANINYLAPLTNYLTKTLSGAINDSANTITLSNTTNMTAPGYIVIDRTNSAGEASPNSREVVSYTGISGSDLTGCTRGADGSTARTHIDASLVETMLTVGMWNSLATIVGKAVTNDGYLRPIASPMSISILQISTMINVSGASIVGIGTADPLTIKNISITSIASIAQANITQTFGTNATITARLNVGQVALNSIASAATAEFDIRNQNGNLVIRPGTSKLVAISVLRQDNTTDAYRTNSVILTGWGYKVSAAATTDTDAVTFGITFSETPIVVCTSGGGKSGAEPTLLGELVTNDYGVHVFGFTIVTTGFTAQAGTISIDGNAPGNLSTNIANWGYTWIAIGTI